VFVTFGGSCSGRDVGSVILSSDGTGSMSPVDDVAVFMFVDVAAVVAVLSLVVLPIEE
jgi:hypothetical protein